MSELDKRSYCTRPCPIDLRLRLQAVFVMHCTNKPR